MILESIDFEFDSAKLKAHSLHVLDAVARALADNPNIDLIEIGGHTDERGTAAYNLDLSNRRAAAVVAYLVDHGIDAKRLSARGYGLTRPIVSNWLPRDAAKLAKARAAAGSDGRSGRRSSRDDLVTGGDVVWRRRRPTPGG